MMKNTGIIRHVDELGRIVIPKKIREKLNIQEKIDILEIFVEGENIILKKYEDSCCICNSKDNLIEYNNKLICKKCVKEINYKHEKISKI